MVIVNEKFVTKDHEGFCKDCQFWVLWYTTTTGSSIYGCRLGVKPSVSDGELVCKWKKKLEVN